MGCKEPRLHLATSLYHHYFINSVDLSACRFVVQIVVHEKGSIGETFCREEHHNDDSQGTQDKTNEVVNFIV